MVRDRKFFLIILVLLFYLTFDSSAQEGSNPETVSSEGPNPDQFPPDSYNKLERPSANGEPTNVFVRIYVYFLGSIDAQNLQFTAHILIRYRWNDTRLNHTRKLVEGEASLKNKLWTPHLYLVNEFDSKVMGSGQDDVLVNVLEDGTVLYSTRLKVTLLCLMNLQKFPFDAQVCPLVMESWSYNTTHLLLHWERHNDVIVNSDLELTEYKLFNRTTNASFSVISDQGEDLPHSYHYYSKFREVKTVDSLSFSEFGLYLHKALRGLERVSDGAHCINGLGRCKGHEVLDIYQFQPQDGNYSQLGVYFFLKREVGHYIMDFYMPSILLVVVSWVSFWLDPNAVPGRTVLGTSTMLTFITLSRNIGSSLPKVSYIKATEIWFIVCTGFIFGSLVEFAFVNTIWRRRKNVELKKVNSKYILKSTLTPTLRRKEMGIQLTDRCKSMNSLTDSKGSSQLSVTTLSTDSILRDPFPKEKDGITSFSISVPTLNEQSNNNSSNNKPFTTMTPQEIACWIDKRSRIGFPITFLVFVILYIIFILLI